MAWPSNAVVPPLSITKHPFGTTAVGDSQDAYDEGHDAGYDEGLAAAPSGGGGTGGYTVV